MSLIYLIITAIVVFRNLRGIEFIVNLQEDELEEYKLRKDNWKFCREHYLFVLIVTGIVSLMWPIRIIANVIKYFILLICYCSINRR